MYLAPAPEDWSEGPATRLLGRGDRDRTPAAPGLWSALETNRRSAALTHDAARGEPRCARPHHVFPAQPWPGTRYGAGASPGERAGSRRDRCHGSEGLRRGRVAGGGRTGGRQGGPALTPPWRRGPPPRESPGPADRAHAWGRLPGRPPPPSEHPS